MSNDDDEMPELSTNEEWRGIMVRARKAQNYTQETLGAAVGLSQVMISKLESGESTSSSYVLKICRLLSIPVPAHFESEQQRAWAQLGRVLRAKRPGLYESTVALVEEMIAQNSEEERPDEVEPSTIRTDRPK